MPLSLIDWMYSWIFRDMMDLTTNTTIFHTTDTIMVANMEFMLLQGYRLLNVFGKWFDVKQYGCILRMHRMVLAVCLLIGWNANKYVVCWMLTFFRL